MFSKTDQSFGVNEVLLSSVLASVVFSIAAAQPLVIVGVTGTLHHATSCYSENLF
jgi:boron transporter